MQASKSRRASRPLPHLDLGDGPALLLMQGFALQPRTYLDLAERLAERCRVIIPALFAEPGGTWSPQRVLDDVEATLDHLGVEQVSVLGHSFGGALQLDFAVRNVERVTELVFVDTLAMSREWTLAYEALHPVHLLWMATPRAAIDFATSVVTHPLCLARAGWWGFRSDRRDHVSALARTDIPRHVLWADRDSLLSRADGASFARDMGAGFTVVHGSEQPVDHDWLYRHPQLAFEYLQGLDLVALRGAAGAGSMPAAAR
ncbi:alpha/beta hydrolase [Acidiferrimicrobium sp. IK]|uniref:alpha/beta fold hydrolase n=1 Tax=Acidiferrimicrobium sp. IK TaxID=2871700 RepID=UPI0021CB3CC6|nr:alpha/beta hydrolase [Acidiferrimicrobium sp. IK]MCU4187109.1 alpha/beta hydrolase [Acidiferrimicrobium sp. IK]